MSKNYEDIEEHLFFQLRKRFKTINYKISNIILDLINSNIFVKSYNKNQHNSKKIEHSS